MDSAESDATLEIIRRFEKTIEDKNTKIKQLKAEKKSEYKRGYDIGSRMLEEKVINENQKLRELLQKNKTGDCWCPCGIDNPMMGGKHSDLCIEIK